MDKLRKVFENEKNKQNLFIIFLIGIALVFVNNFTNEEVNIGEIKAENEDTYTEEYDYTSFLEKKLENILSQVEGAGEVSVMVTLDNDGEKSLAYDQSYSSKETTENDNVGGLRTIKEISEDTTTVFENNNIPIILKESKPKVEGVVILTKAGDNPLIKEAFTNVSMALLDVPAHKIQILKKK